MSPSKTSLACLLLVLGLCCASGREPAWVQPLITKLECGMSLAEIDDLTDREIQPVQAKEKLGTHRIDGKRADVWLGFEEGGLVTVTSGYIDGITSVHRTPKRNLCTGELTYSFSLEWISPLEGADVFWNNQLVERAAKSGLIFDVHGGDHELRVERDGYKPIVKDIHLGPDDPGSIRITLTSRDLKTVQEAP